MWLKGARRRRGKAETHSLLPLSKGEAERRSGPKESLCYNIYPGASTHLLLAFHNIRSAGIHKLIVSVAAEF
jgi:hypothetical protein